jgi:hypothetical protein
LDYFLGGFMEAKELVRLITNAPANTKICVEGVNIDPQGQEIPVVRDMQFDDIIREGSRWIIRSRKNVWVEKG